MSRASLANQLAIQTVGRDLEWKEALIQSPPSSAIDGIPLNNSPVAIVRAAWSAVTGAQAAEVDVYLYYGKATVVDAETERWAKITDTPFEVGPGGIAERVFCAGASRIVLVEDTSATTNGTLAGEVGIALPE